MERVVGVLRGEGRGPDLEIGLGIVTGKGTVRGLGREPSRGEMAGTPGVSQQLTRLDAPMRLRVSASS